MKTALVSLTAAAIALSGMIVAPLSAEAQPRRDRERVYVCDNNVRSSANKGTAIGAVTGALLGSAVAGNGAKTEGGVLGAGVGAVAGHQIAKKNAKKNCRYVYRDRR